MSRELRGLKQLDEATGPKSSLLPPEADKLPIQNRFVPQHTTLEPPKPNSKRWVRASAGPLPQTQPLIPSTVLTHFPDTQLLKGEGEENGSEEEEVIPETPSPVETASEEEEEIRETPSPVP